MFAHKIEQEQSHSLLTVDSDASFWRQRGDVKERKRRETKK